MSINFYKKYLDLKKSPQLSNEDPGFVTVTCHNGKNFKILLGLKADLKPSIFFQFYDKNLVKKTPLKLKNFILKTDNFSRFDGVEKKGFFAQLQYTGNESRVEYFFKIFEDFVLKELENLDLNFTVEYLYKSILLLHDIFRDLRRPNKELIQGLWSEILLIERSSNPDFCLKKFHLSRRTYDFFAEDFCIEVKSTLNDRRDHRFKSEQLDPPDSDTSLIICSVLAKESYLDGLSLKKLVEKLENKISEKSCAGLKKLIERIIFPWDFPDVEHIKFDYVYSSENMNFYFCEDVPRLDAVPQEITNLKFNVDFTSVPAASERKLRLIKDFKNFLD